MEINQLLESIKVEEFKDMVIVYDLESHCQRLFKSINELSFCHPDDFFLFFQNQIKNKAQYQFQKPIGFSSLRGVAEAIQSSDNLDCFANARNDNKPYKLRLIYSKDASFSIEIGPYARDLAREWQVKILEPEEFQIKSTHSQWKHKFYPRPSLQALVKQTNTKDWIASSQAPCNDEIDEIIWTNENGHICEGSFTNIFFQDNNNNWHTPHLNCGILPGTMRAHLIKELAATEGFYLKDKLPEKLLLVNSMFIKEVNPYQQA